MKISLLMICMMVLLNSFQPPVFAQNRYIELKDKINQSEDLINYARLDFLLDPLVPLPEIGFDDPRSNWQIEYELFLTETAELEKIGRCRRDERQRFVCPLLIEKAERAEFRNKIKTKSIRLYQGTFQKNNLAAEANRNFSMLIPLGSPIVKLLNDAKTSANNPAFVLFFKTRLELKNSASGKFKEIREGDAELPFKSFIEGKNYSTFDLNRKEIIVGFGITKSPGGRIMSVLYGH